jgi:histidyl-tRNA synthetase
MFNMQMNLNMREYKGLVFEIIISDSIAQKEIIF